MHQALGLQPYSAEDRVSHLRMTREGAYEVQITTGVTAPDQKGAPVLAHFCSSRLSLLQTKKAGSGLLLPPQAAQDYVKFRNGLWLVERPSIIRFTGVILLGQKIEVITDQSLGALIVPVPACLLNEGPWAFDGGSEMVAKAYGYHSLDALFASAFAQFTMAA